MAGIGFSTNDKSNKSSHSHSTSVEAISKTVSSASMVDFVKIVYLQDLHDTVPAPRVNTFPLMA